ncbi:MAG: PaaI family thioesterase [Betaproteobacteria bacterium]|nr:PaaI family thioesterase [Betaproteobacteria bacterium]
MGSRGSNRKSETQASRIRSARELFRIGMPRALGMRLVSLTPRKVIAEMRVRPMHLNRNGRVNGGALMTLADVMGAAGAVANRPLSCRGGTIESKGNFFAAATGPVIRAVCVPLHIGRTTSVWQTTIRNKGSRIAAIVTQTQIGLPRNDE